MRQSKHDHYSTHSLLRSLALVAVLWCLMAIQSTAFAQMVPSTAAEPAPMEIPENLTREQVRDLVARLSDDQVRELIIQQLDKNALAADQASDATAYFEQLNDECDQQ